MFYKLFLVDKYLILAGLWQMSGWGPDTEASITENCTNHITCHNVFSSFLIQSIKKLQPLIESSIGGSFAWFTVRKITNHRSKASKFHFPKSQKKSKSHSQRSCHAPCEYEICWSRITRIPSVRSPFLFLN